MIVKRTVLVLGAGASKPYGFPSGIELVGQTVRALLDPASDTRRLLSANGFSISEQETFAGQLAGSARGSIDTFLEARPQFRDIGTVAIAAGLIPCESWFSLNSPEAAREDWYRYLWNALGNKVEDIRSNQLTVLTFNYDRSLEFFLLSAAKASWGLTGDEAAKALEPIPIIHLHGKLGELPELAQKGSYARPFNPPIDADSLVCSAETIKIVHDDLGNDSEFIRARASLESAEVICFLGFGFSPVNVHRLFGAASDTQRRIVVASAKGVKPAERFGIRGMFSRDKIKLLDERWGCLRVLREFPVLNWDQYVNQTGDIWGNDLFADHHGRSR
jgi:hypothetical protein